VRSALEHTPPSQPAHFDSAAATLPDSPAIQQAQVTSQFGSELERVGGRFHGLLSPSQVYDRALAIARESNVRSAIVGDGLTLPSDPIIKLLERNGLEIVRPILGNGRDRQNLRDGIASCDLGIIEADYAIAATGTFCVVAGIGRPSSITILPPMNFIVVAADRILPTLADVIHAVGPDRFAAHRVALITGPSRTADIEKLIVIGVHGPRQLHAAAIVGYAGTPRK
jgi:L-lactate utilization protein LutC